MGMGCVSAIDQGGNKCMIVNPIPRRKTRRECSPIWESSPSLRMVHKVRCVCYPFSNIQIGSPSVLTISNSLLLCGKLSMDSANSHQRGVPTWITTIAHRKRGKAISRPCIESTDRWLIEIHIWGRSNCLVKMLTHLALDITWRTSLWM